MIKELYMQDIGTVEVGDWRSGYNYFEKIEQINETTLQVIAKTKLFKLGIFGM